ncbi:MAG: hypothetical protein OXN81_15880 [Alphaproteobacteria bacterium]|nr:hypothetical protein [Alphaproteobacteria bacterium]
MRHTNRHGDAQRLRKMHPARNEIIVRTGLRIRGGVQYWGSTPAGLLCDWRQKG